LPVLRGGLWVRLALLRLPVWLRVRVQLLLRSVFLRSVLLPVGVLQSVLLQPVLLQPVRVRVSPVHLSPLRVPALRVRRGPRPRRAVLQEPARYEPPARRRRAAPAESPR